MSKIDISAIRSPQKVTFRVRCLGYILCHMRKSHLVKYSGSETEEPEYEDQRDSNAVPEDLGRY